MFKNVLSANSIQQIAEYLGQDKIIYAPTETCYIFAANALNEKLVKQILVLKKRSQIPIGILVKNKFMAEKVAELNPVAKKLIETFWPGPLSIVLKKKEIVPDLLTANYPTISMRQSPLPFWQKLFQLIDFPITASSANKHQQDEIYSFEQIYEQFSSQELKETIAVNMGDLPVVLPSTIVSVCEKPAQILRQGPVSQEEIMKVLNQS